MRIVRSVVFHPDSVEVLFMDDTDVRVEGTVYQTHMLTVGRDSNYDDEIRAVEEAVDDLLSDVLEDYRTSPAYDPQIAGEEDDDDDDDE